MTTIPVVLRDGNDFLDISSSLRRGRGDIVVSGPISIEVEDEIRKAIKLAAELSDLGEFEFPDLSRYDLYLSFACRLSELPISGQSYGLGLGVEILHLFSGRQRAGDSCYTGSLDESGRVCPVGMLGRKRESAAREGFSRIFLPATQLEFFNETINQVPVETIFQAWGVLAYGP